MAKKTKRKTQKRKVTPEKKTKAKKKTTPLAVEVKETVSVDPSQMDKLLEMMQRMQSQLRFLERKVDTLLNRGNERKKHFKNDRPHDRNQQRRSFHSNRDPRKFGHNQGFERRHSRFEKSQQTY